MNLKSKKELAARTLGVGKGRISFAGPRKDEINEAITKQDIRDLFAGGAIMIKEARGGKKTGGKKRRGQGKVRRPINKRKREYVILTRKLRNYARSLSSKLAKEELLKIKKKIKNREFKSKNDFKEYLGELNK